MQQLTSFFYCADLQASYTWIQSYTTGVCYVTAKDKLICRIDEIGDVYCKNKPTVVEKTIFGKGVLHIE